LLSTADKIIDMIILISKTAVKNKELGLTFGNNFNFIVETIN